MDFTEIAQKATQNALEYGEKYGVDIDQELATMKLFEEVGEFAQAKLIHDKKSRPQKHVDEAVSIENLAMELADIVGMAMVNAHLLGVDLEEALHKKWVKGR